MYFDIGHYDTYAAIAYIQTAGANATVVSNMRSNFGSIVNNIFSKNDLYRIGMHDWSYHWGSNAMRANYGLMLLTAVKLGETGNYSIQDCQQHAQDYLHFFHGQNPLNMTYLTNMAALGGEHSSWQFYHAWFGDSRNTSSAAAFIGKPNAVIEPDYPYFKGSDNHGINDNKISTYGPAPGFVPGGPNKNYGLYNSANSSPPLPGAHALNPSPGYLDRYYRDWNWNPAINYEFFQPWELTENSIGYQGPYVALGAYSMDNTPTLCTNDNDCNDGLFCNGTETCDTGSGACIAGIIPCLAGETCDYGPEDNLNCALDCESIPITETNCTDGIDNDSDSFTDCSDSDCASDSACQQSTCNNDSICDPGEDCTTCASDCAGRTGGKPSNRYCCGDGIMQSAEDDLVCDSNF